MEVVRVKKLRIGSGAGYGGDRLEPAIDIIQNGNLDYIIFECLAERTIAQAQLDKLNDPNKGYNKWLEYRMRNILPICKEKNVKIVTNMGAANPQAAAIKIKEIALELNVYPLNIAVVLGDDVYHLLDKYKDLTILETGDKLRTLQSSIVSANAYIGAEGIAQALNDGADVVITGRAADPALVLGPLIYEFNWGLEDYHLLGKGAMAGHLLECGSQVTGGYFADPGYKDVPDIWNLGFPIAEISEDGNLIITKLEEAGGLVNPATVKEQVLYEIHDPANYLTPDVIADFSKVNVVEEGTNRVAVSNVTGRQKNNLYKTSIGYQDGFIAECEISYGGSGAYERAKLAGEIIEKRLSLTEVPFEELRIDYIGLNSLYRDEMSKKLHNDGFREVKEVRLRIAGHTTTREDAERIGHEFDSLMTNGPSGGGGVRINIREIIAIASILIPVADVQIEIIHEKVLNNETKRDSTFENR